MKNMKKRQKGFSLLELIVVMVIIGIVSAFAVLGYQAVMGGTKDSLQTTRLIQLVDAQNKFKTVKGKRRYASLTELCQEGLLNEKVVKFDANCDQTDIDGWSITPLDESQEYLREHFFVVLRKGELKNSPIFCIGDDGILRKGAKPQGGIIGHNPKGGVVCDVNSPPVEP